MNSESLTWTSPSVESHPLSPLQQGMLFYYLSSEDQGFDVVQLVISLREVVDKALLKDAWRRVVARHVSLQSAFQWRDCVEPRQVVYPGIEVPWQEHNWLQVPSAGREQHLASFLVDDRRRGIQMDNAESWRLALVRWESEEFSLIWTFHHALLDGRSFVTVVREVFALYDASKNGAIPTLPPARSYGDYLEWMARQDFSPSESFWRSHMSGFAAPTPLPGKAATGKVGSQKKKDLAVQLSSELTTRLKDFAHTNGITLNTLTQGVWALFLSRHSGEEDIVFGGTRACRKSSVEGIETMVGLFINTLPVRVEVRPESEITSWLRSLRRQWVEMRNHEHTPLSKVQGWSDVPGNLPLFNSIVVFDHASPNEILRAGGDWLNRDLRVFEQTTFPLTLAVQGGEKLRLQIGYHTDQYSEDAAARMLGHLQVLLEAIIEPGCRKLGDLPILTADERHQLLNNWNKTEKDYGNKLCVHELIELQAKRTPNRIALTCEGSSCSYGELNAKANHVAGMLQKMGVGRGSFVPLLLDAGIDLVIAELAIMKAGAAFVPLDPRWPALRIQSTLRELPHTVILTGQAPPVEAESLTGRVITVCRDELPCCEVNPASGVQRMDPIYLLFTSGSTGKPKGAINHHAGIANRFFNMNDRFGCGETDVILATTSHVFDSSVWQFFWPLTNGGRVVIPSPRSGSDPQYLLELMTRERITVTDFVPTLLSAITDQMDEDASLSVRLSSLRHILVGGEAIIPAVAYRFKAHLPEAGVTNAYGPTETSIGVIFYELPKEPVDSLPIGKPLRNVYAVILDQNLNLVPVGVPGDLYIGGICVGLGYLNNEEATRAAFIPNPFPELNTSRLYRTGDRAKFLPDGNIAFLGRLDAQVKIRGFRVELGEIETLLVSHPQVQHAVVVARDYQPGDRRLVAYIVPNSPIPEVSELRKFLKSRLPGYMVPTAFSFLDALPLAPGGKVDRRKLPAPDFAERKDDESFELPGTDLERQVASVWAEALKLERIGRSDDFFQLGGHSLLAVAVIHQLRTLIALDIPLSLLFEHPDVAGFSMAIQKLQKEASVSRPPFLRPRDYVGDLPSAFHPSTWAWLSTVTEVLPYELEGDLDLDALEQAMNALIARHEILRTTFPVENGLRLQKIDSAKYLKLEVTDLTRVRDAETIALQIVEETSKNGLDATREWPFKMQVLRISNKKHWLLLMVHHVACDEWSMGILLREFSSLYAAFLRKEPHTLKLPALQFADFTLWRHDWITNKGEFYQKQIAYWETRLGGGLKTTDVPIRPQSATRTTVRYLFDRSEPLRRFKYRIRGILKKMGPAQDAPDPAQTKIPFEISPVLSQEIYEISQREGVTVYITLLAAFNAFLHITTGETDIAIKSLAANRDQPGLHGIVGYVADSMLLRTNITKDLTFPKLLHQVRETVHEALAHHAVPYAEMTDELRRRGINVPIEFPVVFQVITLPWTTFDLSGVTTQNIDVPTHTIPYGFQFVIRDQRTSLSGYVRLNTTVYDRAAAVAFLARYRKCLEVIAANRGIRLADLVAASVS